MGVETVEPSADAAPVSAPFRSIQRGKSGSRTWSIFCCQRKIVDERLNSSGEEIGWVGHTAERGQLEIDDSNLHSVDVTWMVYDNVLWLKRAAEWQPMQIMAVIGS